MFANQTQTKICFIINFFYQDDVRRVKRDLEKSSDEKAAMTTKIEELHLYNDSSNRELKVVIKTKQVSNII